MEYTCYTNSVNMYYMNTENELTRLISEEMKKRNLGVREAASIIGTSHPTLGRALAGEKISFEFAVQLAPFLHLPPESVMRVAGLLSPKPTATEQTEKILYLFEQMGDKDRQTILDMMEFLLKK